MALSWVERMKKAKNREAVMNKIMDRLAELAPQIKQLRALEAETAELKNALELFAQLEDYASSSEVSFANDDIQVNFSPVPLKRKVKDVKGLMKALGIKTFLQCITISLEKLDEHMTREEQKKFFTFKRSGTRACRIQKAE